MGGRQPVGIPMPTHGANPSINQTVIMTRCDRFAVGKRIEWRFWLV